MGVQNAVMFLQSTVSMPWALLAYTWSRCTIRTDRRGSSSELLRAHTNNRWRAVETSVLVSRLYRYTECVVSLSVPNYLEFMFEVFPQLRP